MQIHAQHRGRTDIEDAFQIQSHDEEIGTKRNELVHQGCVGLYKKNVLHKVHPKRRLNLNTDREVEDIGDVAHEAEDEVEAEGVGKAALAEDGFRIEIGMEARLSKGGTEEGLKSDGVVVDWFLVVDRCDGTEVIIVIIISL